MAIEIYLGEPPPRVKEWIRKHYEPAADPKTYIKFSDGTEFYDVIEFPDGLDGIFDLRTAVKYGWTNEGHDGYDGSPSWDNKYPAEVVLGSNVTSIGYCAFSDCSGLTSVTIPDTVMSIGSNAFRNCSGLMSVTIPDSVISIADSVFDGCNASLFDVTTIPNVKLVDGWVVGYTEFSGDLNLTGTRGIAGNAFSYCSGLTRVTIPDSVTSIGYFAFSGCSELKSVTIPGSVTSIGRSAFSGCSDLTSVEFKGRTLAQVKAIPDTSGNLKYPWGVTEDKIIPGIVENKVLYTTEETPNTWIEGEPEFNTSTGTFSGFAEKKDAVKIVIPSKVDGIDVTSIGSSAFDGCSGLTSVTIPDSVTSIGNYAFDGCSGLTSVTIPDSVTSIGGFAFSGCRGLTSVTIPDSVTSIGSYAFRDCSGLTSVEFEGNAPDVGNDAFAYVATGCKAIVSSTATGFPAAGETWNGLVVEVKS